MQALYFSLQIWLPCQYLSDCCCHGAPLASASLLRGQPLSIYGANANSGNRLLFPHQLLFRKQDLDPSTILSAEMTLSSSPELFAPCPDLKLSRKEAYMQPFRFLDLPAVEFRSGLAKVSMLTPLLELRNYTYNLIAEATQHASSIEIYNNSTPWYARRPVYNWGFMGLTQSCRTLRSEFRPLYMAKLQVTIEAPDVPVFLNTFLSSALTAPQSSPRTVCIHRSMYLTTSSPGTVFLPWTSRPSYESCARPQLRLTLHSSTEMRMVIGFCLFSAK